MATMKDLMALFKSASLLSGDQETNYMEAEDIYSTAFKLCEELKDGNNGNIDREEFLTNWAIALGNYCKLKRSAEEKAKQFEKAQLKYEEALLVASQTNKHLILYNWGNLLLDMGIKAKKDKNTAQASDMLAKACAKYNEAYANKHDYIGILYNWQQALSEQAELASGNDRLWFQTQIAEKGKWIDKLKNNEVLDGPVKIELAPQDKLRKGTAEKELGNEFFKKGELSNALLHYHNGLNYANGLYGLPSQDEKVLKELKASIYNNMAAVHLKQGKTDRALTDLQLVLGIEPNNVKALFRRGKLFVSVGDLDKARIDLEKANEISPADNEILRELQVLEKKEKEQVAKAKKIYGKMFE